MEKSQKCGGQEDQMEEMERIDECVLSGMREKKNKNQKI